MNLIKCPECGKEISSNAGSCIFCGHRIIKSVFVQNLGFDGEVFRVIIAAGICCILAGILFGWWLIAFGFGLSALGTLFLLIRSLK